MSMQITDEQVRAIVAKSILDALPEAQRAEMLQKAIASILTPAKESYSYGRNQPRSVLEEQFQSATAEQVREIVRELVSADDGLKGRIREVVTAAVTKALASDALVDTLAQGILNAFTVRER